MRWLDFIFPPRVDEIIVRDISADDFLALVAPRLVPETRPGTVALLPYHDERVRSVIHEAKYHGSKLAFQLLALAVVEYLRDADDFARFDLAARSNLAILVPIPLGEKRRKERGYNQTEEVATRAAKLLGCAVHSGILVRTRETISQVSLPRHKREKNMRGAFTASLKLRSASDAAHSVDSSHTFIILDDVLTTGATLQAAIDALKKAGAEHIIPLALAH
jgi:ComF family protein